MEKRDYYEVLGVSKTATDAEIKKAFRQQAKKYHPDIHPGDKECEEKFKEAQEAYAVLSDPDKRRQYDQFGHAAFEEGAGGAGYGEGGFNRNGGFDGSGFSGFGGFGNSHSGAYRSPDGSYQEFHFEGGDMDDILKNLFGGGFGGGSNSGKAGSAHGFGGSGFGHSGFENGSFRSGFNGSFGSGGFDGTGYGDGFGNSCNSGFSGSHQKKGQDLNAEISISFNEATFGCDKLINLSGADGSGKQTLKVHIPAGIDNGKSIRLRGKGNPGYGGAPAGDLLLKVHVGERPGFERKGTDVYTTVNVPFITAALGGEAKVQTLNGQVMCRIPEGTQSGSKIRLKGKGVPSLRNSNVRGDHYVTLVVQTPTKLNEKAKEALRAFDEACGNRQVPEAKAADGENTAEQPKKKKGFMDKVKEAFEDIDK